MRPISIRARSSRFGVMSSAYIERDTSSATITSWPLAAQRLDAGAELGPGQRQREERHRGQDQHALPAHGGGIDGVAKPAHQIVFAEAVEERPPAFAGLPVEQDQQRDQGEGPERDTGTEAEHYGSVLSQVRPSTTSASRKSSPAASGTGKRSP